MRPIEQHGHGWLRLEVPVQRITEHIIYVHVQSDSRGEQHQWQCHSAKCSSTAAVSLPGRTWCGVLGE